MGNIAIVGLGRLGICLALNLERVGYNVLGIDINSDHVDRLNKRFIDTCEPMVSELLSNSVNFSASTNVDLIFEKECTDIFVVIQTPSKLDGSFDHQHIESFLSQLLSRGKPLQAKRLIINSTCMPGFCDSIDQKLLDCNYDLLYNPEFIAQGSIIKDQQEPDQVLIGGSNEESRMALQRIYENMCTNQPTFCHMSLISAEITKLATNCFLTTKIAFANAIGDLATICGGEPDKILQAIGCDKRIGHQYLKYGFGYGGPCFPRDNKAFANFSQTKNLKMLIAESTDLANDIHHEFLLQQKLSTLESSTLIEFDSVCYKPGTDILEESQQLRLALDLAKSGYRVKITESEAVVAELILRFGHLFVYNLNGK